MRFTFKCVTQEPAGPVPSRNNTNNGAASDKDEQDTLTFTPFTEEELVLFKSPTSKRGGGGGVEKCKFLQPPRQHLMFRGAELLW